MTFQKSEPAKYDYEMPSRSQHGSTTKTSSNTETTTTKAAEESNEKPFWENPTDDDDDDATVDTFFAKLFRRAEGKEDASTTNTANPANDNDDGTVDTFFAKLLNKDGRDDEASVSVESTSGEQLEQRNYGEFVQYMDFLELVEFMNALKTKTSGMPPQKIESKVEQLEKLMEETKVGQQSDDNDSNSTWKFLEFLMGKKNDETPESKVHYQNFLWWLSSPPGTNPTSFQSEKGPSKEDIWKDIVDGMAEKEERVSVKATMTALWNYIVTPPFVQQSSSSSSSTKQSGIWSWFGYGASATPKVEEQQPKEEANDGIDKAQELEEDANTSTASSDNHIV
eukprot:CAMPEP_0196143032 /NCGR_PEP_ID=MMETSP0910-20130528/12577_1 /TAXON_ID=49265 /ORGANISM="Thalassiosira rotula, Strain GSO102" /LENGTH=337 /DNA_ID=CAMNT_0041404421 /DNA_START=203 /DNA_END=1216 /DNA_ORIENTATION=+